MNSPDAVVLRVWKRISKRVKITFTAVMVIGLMTHMTVLTNKLPNHDDAWYMYGYRDGVQSGRWLLEELLAFDGRYSMPWLLGLLSLVFLALAACVVTKLFRINGIVGCTLAAALMVTFPSVVGTFAYMFTADAYFFGLLLATLAAYVATREHWLALPMGALLLMLSLGIYQSYLSVAVGLMVGALIFEVLDAEKSFVQLVVKGVKLLLTIIMGLVGYMGMVRWTTRDIGLTDYMGINEMGHVSLASLPSLIAKCYSEYVPMFFKNTLGYNLAFDGGLLAVAALVAAVLAAWLVVQKKPGLMRGLMAAILMMLMPLACNLIHIMINGGHAHTLMLYGMVLMPVFVIGLFCEALTCTSVEEVDTKQRIVTATSWLLVGVLSITAFSYVVTANEAYFKMTVTFEQTKAYSSRLLTTVQETNGYKEGMPLVIVDVEDKKKPALKVENVKEPWIVGVIDMPTFIHTYSYDNFLARYMAYPGSVYGRDSDESKQLATNATVKAMPSYPSEGSTKIINGKVVVKLAQGK